jgi:hypothetical protein
VAVDEWRATTGAGAQEPGTGGRGPVASTSCLVVVLAVALAVLVIAPAVLWCAGIVCGR